MVCRCSRTQQGLNAASGSGDIHVDHVGGTTIESAPGGYRDLKGGRPRSDLCRKRWHESGGVLPIRPRHFDGVCDVFVGLASGRTVKAGIKTLSGEYATKTNEVPGDNAETMALSISSFSGDVTLTSVK